MEYNIYCDESCHLERDTHDVMVLAAVSCPKTRVRSVSDRIRELKRQHGYPISEVKWGKISHTNIPLYLDLVKLFFDDEDLRFRGLVAKEKQALRHDDFGQDHDTWYYKMYFLLLNGILAPKDTFNIYLDMKDTRGVEKRRKLHEVLCNAKYDFRREIVLKVQQVRSQEVEILQFADIFAGVLAYCNEGSSSSQPKLAVIEKTKELSGYCLTKSTLIGEPKFNIFCWHPRTGNL